MLRSFNRMNDFIPGARAEGRILFAGQNILEPSVDPGRLAPPDRDGLPEAQPIPQVDLRERCLGRPRPRLHGELDELVEISLRKAALWEEVKDKLNDSALSLAGGQQQRLCIARALAVEPEIILMDEPCSALDPIATLKIEDLMRQLAVHYTIVIVTHNMQQAARVSDYTAMMMMDDQRAGSVIEMGPTKVIFTRPRDKRTEDYVTGRFG